MVELEEEEVAEIVKKTFPGSDVVCYGAKSAQDYPAGFLGEHRRLTVRIRRGNTDVEKVYFVKEMPGGSGDRRKYLERVRCFYKEIAMYERVFAKMEGVSEGIPKWRPDCYYARGEELIVMEDLMQDGYYMYRERALMDEEHILSSLDALARMHASSIVYEENLKHSGGVHRTLAEEFGQFFFETVATREKDHPGNLSHEAAITAQVKLVDILPGYTSEQKEIIKRELPFRLRRLFHLVKPSQKFRNVVVHGDIWANNIMFVKGEDGKVKNAKILDFQLARYAPPAHDITAFLHLVQTKEYRDNNLYRLLRHYYDVLSRCLAKNGLSAGEHITWYELLGTWDYYEELGVITAIFFFQLILTPPDLCKKYFASPDSCVLVDPVRRTELVKECFLRDSLYSQRVTDIMNELINEYIL